jgi:hypothetical protein
MAAHGAKRPFDEAAGEMLPPEMKLFAGGLFAGGVRVSVAVSFMFSPSYDEVGRIEAKRSTSIDHRQ